MSPVEECHLDVDGHKANIDNFIVTNYTLRFSKICPKCIGNCDIKCFQSSRVKIASILLVLIAWSTYNNTRAMFFAIIFPILCSFLVCNEYSLN